MQNSLVNRRELVYPTFSVAPSITESSVLPLDQVDRKVQEAGEILRARFRGKNLRDSLLMPSQLKGAFKLLLSDALSKIERRDLGLIIAHEHLNMQKEGRSKESHFNKKKIYIIDSVQYRSPLTFYLEIDNVRKKTILSLNLPKSSHRSFLGRGGNKNVYLGYDLNIPLEVDGEGCRKITLLRKTAIARPLHPKTFQKDVVNPNQFHIDAYSRLKKDQLAGYITVPPKLRKHRHKVRVKQELVQDYYFGDLYQLIIKKNKPERFPHLTLPSYEESLLFAENIFETLEAIHEMGIMHNDIKPANFMLDSESAGGRHALMNDFDLANKSMLSWAAHAPYLYWDFSRMLGFVTPSNDILGGMVSTYQVIFGIVLDNGIEDLMRVRKLDRVFLDFVLPFLAGELDVFGDLNISKNLQRDVLELLKNLSNDHSDPERRKEVLKLLFKAEACIKLIEVFDRVFAKEESWYKMLLGSCICHFSKLMPNQYENWIQDGKHLELLQLFKINLDGWFERKFRQLSCDKLNHMILTAVKYHRQFPELSFVKSLIDIFESSSHIRDRGFSRENKLQIIGLIDFYKSFEKIGVEHLPDSADSELFKWIASEDPEKFRQVRQMCYDNFGRAGNLKSEIQAIREEYLLKLKNLET